MLRIYRIFFLVLSVGLVSAQVFADTSPLDKFIMARNGSQAEISKINSVSNLEYCFFTSSHLICLEKKAYPNLKTNPLARQAMIQGLSLKVKHSLYEKLLKTINIEHFRNEPAARATYLSGIDAGKNNFQLKNVEFSSYAQGNNIISVASVSLENYKDLLVKKLQEPFFLQEYGNYLFNKVNAQLQTGDKSGSIPLVQELLQIKYKPIDSGLLAIKAFIANNQLSKAKQIADNLLSKSSSKLSSDQAEELGDLFIILGNEKMAEAMYIKAMENYK